MSAAALHPSVAQLVEGDPIHFQEAGHTDWGVGNFVRFAGAPGTNSVLLKRPGARLPVQVQVQGLVRHVRSLGEAVLHRTERVATVFHLGLVKEYVPGKARLRVQRGAASPRDVDEAADLRPLDPRLVPGASVWYFGIDDYTWKQGKIRDLKLDETRDSVHPDVQVEGNDRWHPTFDDAARIGTLLLVSDLRCEGDASPIAQRVNLMDMGNPTLLGVTQCLADRLMQPPTTPAIQYTRLDESIVSMNPFETLAVNGKEYLKAHARLDLDHHLKPKAATARRETDADKERVPANTPHVAEVVYRACVELLQPEAKPQSIIVSGASGSGKTRNAMLMLDYLHHLLDVKTPNELQTKLDATNVLLNAFGNAKSPRNDDSSRFGKYIKIFLTRDDTVTDMHPKNRLKIAGIKVIDYLLERTRSTDHLPQNDRLYHAFYYFAHWGSKEEQTAFRRRLYPDDAKTAKNTDEVLALRGDRTWPLAQRPLETEYLHEEAKVIEEYDNSANGPKRWRLKADRLDSWADSWSAPLTDRQILDLTERNRLADVRNAFKSLGFAPEFFQEVRDMLFFILCNRCVTFTESARLFHVTDWAKADNGPLKEMADYIDRTAISSDSPHRFTVAHLINQNACHLKTESAIYHPNLSEGFLIGHRNAYSRQFYLGIWERILAHANNKLKPPGSSKPELYLGILDIFGFENFKVNRLGQLCINYTNEVIAAVYNREIFAAEQAALQPGRRHTVEAAPREPVTGRGLLPRCQGTPRPAGLRRFSAGRLRRGQRLLSAPEE